MGCPKVTTTVCHPTLGDIGYKIERHISEFDQEWLSREKMVGDKEGVKKGGHKGDCTRKEETLNGLMMDVEQREECK